MYYQPREFRNITICGAADVDCIKGVEQKIRADLNSSFKCSRCLSGCFEIHYESSVSMATIFDEIPFLRRNNLKSKNIAIVHAYYGKSTFRSQRKEELVGFTDFLCKIFNKFY